MRSIIFVLALLAGVLCTLAEDPRMYSQVSGTTTALSGTGTLRAQDLDAIYSCVTNSGTGSVVLFEGTTVVGVLGAGQLWSSFPKSGKLALTGSGTSTVTVATYK